MTPSSRFTIAILQLNPTVGDLSANAARIAVQARRATDLGADLCVTPELSLVGYPPRDLLLDGSFIARTRDALARLATELQSSAPVLVGVPEINDGPGRPLFNSTVLLRRGRVAGRFRKSLLPTYDVFDEDRYFEPGTGVDTCELDGRRIAISVCEDVWHSEPTPGTPARYPHDPLRHLDGVPLAAVINVSASPFVIGKQIQRERLLARHARRFEAPVVYVNQVGGNDDLVFDGRSVVVGADGRVVMRAAAFAEDLLLFDVTHTAASEGVVPCRRTEEELYEALVLGTRDYARKCGFSTAVLGLSGGIDSAVTAAIACDAIGPDCVDGLLLPSPWTSQASIDDAEDLAGRLGMRTRTVPITPMLAAYDGALSPLFAGRERDTTEENVQARVRGTILMAVANKTGALLLTTGNKSELAVGYCTLYGDMAGGLAVIADVPKTLVYRLAAFINRTRMVIPPAIIERPPTAELRPGQRDDDDLPPYDLLDRVLDGHIQEHRSREALVADGYPEVVVERVVSLVARSEFKRRQAAPGLKVTDRAFGTGWRMPIARRVS